MRASAVVMFALALVACGAGVATTETTTETTAETTAERDSTIARENTAAREDTAEPVSSIEMLESVLDAHPDDPSQTPDALLYLAAMLAAQTTSLEDETASFARPIALVERLLEDFPEYGRRGAALYLLGRLRADEGQTDGALAAFRHLLCANAFPSLRMSTVPVENYEHCEPQPVDSARLIPEAWMRLGELHFDDPATLQWTISAFQHAVVGELAPLARYKIAWSYYRLDHYRDALMAFRELLDHDPGELRAECIQYVAIVLVELDWDGDGTPDTSAVDRLADESVLPAGAAWRSEVLAEVVSVLRMEARDDEAEAVRQRFAISTAPSPD